MDPSRNNTHPYISVRKGIRISDMVGRSASAENSDEPNLARPRDHSRGGDPLKTSVSGATADFCDGAKLCICLLCFIKCIFMNLYELSNPVAVVQWRNIPLISIQQFNSNHLDENSHGITFKKEVLERSWRGLNTIGLAINMSAELTEP